MLLGCSVGPQRPGSAWTQDIPILGSDCHAARMFSIGPIVRRSDQCKPHARLLAQFLHWLNCRMVRPLNNLVVEDDALRHKSARGKARNFAISRISPE